MTEWVAVVQEEGDEPIEIPTEGDGTMLLTSVTAQFPGVTGLKFRNPSTGVLRGIRCHNNILYPPEESGWGNTSYICTRPAGSVAPTKKEEAALKRKSEYDTDGMSSKNQRVDGDDDMSSGEEMTCDLIVLGIPWKASDSDVREYFEKFGDISMVQLKTKESGQSKGYAFVRFKDMEVQNKVLLTRHMILDRWCDVKIPESQEVKASKAAASTKIFVARMTEAITESDLRDHFEKFGSVTDVYVPKPFRSFAFVSFREARVAQSLFGKDHIIKGVSVHIGSAQPKSKDSGRSERGGYGGGGRGGVAGGYDGGYHGSGPHGGNFGGNMGYQNPWTAGNPSGGGYSRGNRGPFY